MKFKPLCNLCNREIDDEWHIKVCSKREKSEGLVIENNGHAEKMPYWQLLLFGFVVSIIIVIILIGIIYFSPYTLRG